MQRKTKSAFTLIELLVVIAIIGILATLAIVALQQARQNARDAKRVADVKQVSTALELFFNDNQSYPDALEELQTGGYMQILPSAPTPVDYGCENEENDYSYTVSTNKDFYQLRFCTGKQVADLTPGSLCMTPGGLTTNCELMLGETDPFAGASGTFIDLRDSQLYTWVRIGDQIWMSEDLKYLPSVHPSNVGGIVNSYYYVQGYNGTDVSIAKSLDNFNYYGVLYNWPAAMAGYIGEGVQGVCPDGWHLPTDSEWTVLTDYLGSNPGDQLKASINDSPISWDGNNISGLTVLPSGSRNTDGLFHNLNSYSNIWSSSSTGVNAWFRYVGSGISQVNRTYHNQAYGFSVRCIKD